MSFANEPELAWRSDSGQKGSGEGRTGNDSGDAFPKNPSRRRMGTTPSCLNRRRMSDCLRGGPQMNTQTIARVTGVLFLITFVTAIPALILYNPVLDNARYIVGGGADTRIAFGAFLEMILIVANIGTAVALFPILKRQNEGAALGYVTARVMECAFIAVGLLSLMAIVTLRQDIGGVAGASSLIPVGRSLVAIHDWTFVLGPGWIVGVGNGLLLGYLMYRSGLVPRAMAMLGLIGGPLIIASGTAVLFDVVEPGSTGQVIATIPEFFWELSLGIYLIVKGFKPSPILAMDTTVKIPESASAEREGV